MRFLSRTCLAAAAIFAAADAKAADPDATLGMKPPEGAVVLFDGNSLDGWVKKDGSGPAPWPVKDGFFAVGPKTGDIKTKATFGDFTLHVEFNVPYMPEAKGQARGNSGVYLQGAYELQVLDSYGLKSQNNDCVGIYQQVVPAVNACKPPLQWQTYDITFNAAKGDKKARLSVVQNGQKIIDDKEIAPTPGGINDFKVGGPGPILLQDHGNDVQYRNIWIVPAK